MKRNLLLIFLTTGFINAQKNYTIEYEHLLYDTIDKYGASWKVFEKLVTNDNESNSYIKSIDTTLILSGNENISIQEATDYSLTNYKDIKNSIFYSNTLFSKYNLSDSIYQIQWEIKSESKKILNYNCQLARGKLRGRVYSAYFTTEIPIKNGPHKFDGLPGLILEVFSDDKCVYFKAKSIITTDEKIENTFLNKPLISWKIFSKEYKKLFDKMENYKPDEGVSYSIQNRTVEYNFEPD